MTETKWLASTDDPRHMVDWLAFLSHPDLPTFKRPSDRKLRLFACACFRLNAKGIEAQIAFATACEAWADGGPIPPRGSPRYWIGETSAAGAARFMVDSTDPVHAVAYLREIVGNPVRPPRVTGPHNPDKSPRDYPLLHLELLTPQVLSLAEAAYAHRHQGTGELEEHRLLVLADALEEQGCQDDFILNHLRGLDACPTEGPPIGPHVRGCWALDLILSKE